MQTLQVGTASSETQFLHYCYICNTQLNSCKQALLHCSGKRHRKKLNFLQTRKGNQGSTSAALTGFYHGDSLQPKNNNAVDQKQPSGGALVPLQQAHLYPPAAPPVHPQSQAYSSLSANNVISQIEPNPSSFNHPNPSPLLAGMIRTPNALYEGTTLQGGLHYPIVGACNYPPLHTKPDSNGWYTYSADFPVAGHPPSIPAISPGPVPSRSTINNGLLPVPSQKVHAFSQPPPGPLLNSPPGNTFITYQQETYNPSEDPVNCNNNPLYIYHNGYSCYSNSDLIANSESGHYASIPNDSTAFDPSLQPNSQTQHSWLLTPPLVNVPPINTGTAPPMVQTDMSVYARTTPLSSSYSGGTGSRSNIVSPSETSSISSDSLASGARTTYSCLVCGQQYPTLSLLHNHLQSARHYRTGHAPANMIQEHNMLNYSTKKPSENPSSLEAKLKTPPMLFIGERSGALIHYCSVCHIAADSAPSGAKETALHEASNGSQTETSPSSSSIGDSPAYTPPRVSDPSPVRAISRSSSTSSEMVEPTRDSGYVSGSGNSGIPAEPCACQQDVADEGLPAIRFHCQLCNIFLNSPVQAKQHISSQKHQVRASGKLQTFRRKFGSYRKRLLSSQLTAAIAPVSPGEVGGDTCPTTTDESSDSPTSDDATAKKTVANVNAPSAECYAGISGDEDSEVEGLGSGLGEMDSSGDDHEGYDYVITILPESTEATLIQLGGGDAREMDCLTDQTTVASKVALLGLGDGKSGDQFDGDALSGSGVGIVDNVVANSDGSIGLGDFCDNFPPLSTTTNDNR